MSLKAFQKKGLGDSKLVAILFIYLLNRLKHQSILL